MGKTIIHGGAQVRTTSMGTAAFIDMKAANDYKPARQITPVMTERQLGAAPWAPWGSDNLQPQKMVADIKRTGILSGIIDGKARFALCEGMTPAQVRRNPATGQREIVKYIENDGEINQFMDLSDQFTNSFGWLKDMIALGSGASRLMLNKGKNKVAVLQRDDFSEVRFEKRNDSGISENVYMHAEWQKCKGRNDKALVKVPLLNKYNPLEDLKEKAAAGIVEHEITFAHPSWGCHYYPDALWYAAHKWVEIAQGVPEMKAAMFQNSMLVKYLVVIYEEYWESAFPDGAWENFGDDERREHQDALYNEIEKFLVGAENAHKSLFIEGIRDKVNGHQWQHIEIKVIENNTPEGQLLPDAASANSEIAFSMLFNPAIIGASMPSGPYTNSQGGSSVRESVLLQIILHELERRNIQRVMNVVKWFNGWAEKYPGLEFIIPATVLTTLDTGAGSKPVQLGAGNAQGSDQKDTNTDSQTVKQLKHVA